MAKISEKVFDDMKTLMAADHKLTFSAARAKVVQCLSPEARLAYALEPSREVVELTTYSAPPPPRPTTFSEVAHARIQARLASGQSSTFHTAMHAVMREDKTLARGYALEPGSQYAA